MTVILFVKARARICSTTDCMRRDTETWIPRNGKMNPICTKCLTKFSVSKVKN